MDIKSKTKSKSIAPSSTSTPASANPFKSGVIQTADAKLMLPPVVQTKLSAIGTKYGVPFDLSNIGLDGKMAENVKALRSIADMATADSKLLPEMMKLIRQLFRAEIKLAQFHKLVTKASIKHQEKLDKQTADIFLAMAGYGAKATKLEHRTNVREQLKVKRTQAYANYYDNSVYGEESKIIDAEFELLESNRKILATSKTKKVEFEDSRKKGIQAYIDSAFTE